MGTGGTKGVGGGRGGPDGISYEHLCVPYVAVGVREVGSSPAKPNNEQENFG